VAPPATTTAAALGGALAPRYHDVGYYMQLPGYRIVVFMHSRWVGGRWQARVVHCPSGQALYSRHQKTVEDAKRVAFHLLLEMVAWVAAVREQYRREDLVGNLSTPAEIMEWGCRKRGKS
jgi:hypothetical protein